MVSGKYEHSNDGIIWVENTFGSNSDQVTNVYTATYFAVQNPSRQYHRLTVQKHSGQNIQLAQIMLLSNAPYDVDRFTVAKIDLDDPQLKISADFSLQSTHSRFTIIGTANLRLFVTPGLPENFEVDVIADGGTVTFFASGGAVFKFNNSKILLASGGIATLRKENGTNNFYLKGDLS